MRTMFFTLSFMCVIFAGRTIAASAYHKEIKDTGDQPLVAGCLEIYSVDNTTCAGDPGSSAGDYCQDQNTLMERMETTTCNNAEPDPKTYTCANVLANSKCVWIDNYCSPGYIINGTKSARCQVVPTANPAPGLEDLCACVPQSGETIIANDCPTATGYEQCPTKGCYLQDGNGQITYRGCEASGR